jgi:hypothetical protein
VDSPKVAIWRYLRYWSYPAYVQERLRERPGLGGADAGSGTANEIAYSIAQASEYFEAADRVGLHTKPLQAYYGTISLLTALRRLAGWPQSGIGSHGLRYEIPSADVLSSTVHLSSQSRGAATQFLPAMQDDPPWSKRTWSVRDCLGAIPDVVEEIIRGGFTSVQAHAIPAVVADTDEGLAPYALT